MSRGPSAGPTPPPPPLGFRHLAVAASTDQKKKIGKKHPGKAILAGVWNNGLAHSLMWLEVCKLEDRITWDTFREDNKD